MKFPLKVTSTDSVRSNIRLSSLQFNIQVLFSLSLSGFMVLTEYLPLSMLPITGKHTISSEQNTSQYCDKQ